MQRDRAIEDEADLLLTVSRSAPARSDVCAECRFNGKARILRRYLDSRDLFESEPGLIRLTSSLLGMIRYNNPLPHTSIFIPRPFGSIHLMASASTGKRTIRAAQ